MIFAQFKRVLRPNLERVADRAKVLIAGRATSKYMRDSGATTPEAQRELGRNNRTGAGSLRIVSGRLARSLLSVRESRAGGNTEGYSKIEVSNSKISLTVGTDVPYADVHEHGFSGTVSIPSHNRTITQAFGRRLDSPKQIRVSSHSRQMTIAPRPYLRPALEDSIDDISELIVGAFLKSTGEIDG